MKRFTLAGLAVLLLGASIARADIITGVSFTGVPSNPTITVDGFGFLPVPTATTLGYPGFTGFDYGTDLYLQDLSTTHGFNAGAGFAGPNRDYIGLTILSYTDKQIVFQLGSDYAQFYFPAGIYALEAGDPFRMVVKNDSYTGIVGQVAPTPEPSSALLLLTGMSGCGTLLARRKRATA